MKKKSQLQLPAAALDLIAIIGTTLILFLFVIFIAISGNKQQKISLNAASSNIEGNTILLNYLRTPTTQGTNADYIVELYLNNKITDLENPLKEFFDPIYDVPGTNHWRTWGFKIYLMPEEKEVFNKVGFQGTFRTGHSYILLGSNILPLPNKNSYLKIELYKEGTGEGMDKRLYYPKT